MLRKLTIASITTCSIILIFALIYPFQFLSLINALSPYRTQTVIYRHIDNPDIRIEFQMKDIGALGYQKRIVLIKPGFLLDEVESIDETLLDKSSWRKVNENINELELKS